MSTRSGIVALAALLVLVLFAAVSCGAPAPAREAVAPAATAAPAAIEAPAAPASTAAPIPTVPPAPEDRGASTDASANPGEPVVVQPGSPSNRKIIKDAELNLLVDQIVRAVDRATTIAANSGGYILSTELNTQGDGRTATVKLGVPSEAFEDVLRQLRAIALTVNWERATGTDVTSEYVDLQSQLTNLKATQARLREFLNQAKTVEEALQVNAELSKIEGEIETIQGRINYLGNRSAYSTVTLYLEQIAPTPTVTPTPSITPTPTSTATATPIVWHPDETFQSAGITLQYVLRGLGDVLIWAGVVCLPLGLIALIILLPIVLVRRRSRRARAAATVAPPPVLPPDDKPAA
jgi:hypothetical protein